MISKSRFVKEVVKADTLIITLEDILKKEPGSLITFFEFEEGNYEVRQFLESPLGKSLNVEIEKIDYSDEEEVKIMKCKLKELEKNVIDVFGKYVPSIKDLELELKETNSDKSFQLEKLERLLGYFAFNKKSLNMAIEFLISNTSKSKPPREKDWEMLKLHLLGDSELVTEMSLSSGFYPVRKKVMNDYVKKLHMSAPD